MEEKAYSFTLKSLHLSECDLSEKELIEVAVDYLQYSHAPYSKFYVGASVLLEDGSIYGGANQENASYPLCMCGERVALYHAAMAQPMKKIRSIAITAKNEKMKLIRPVMPCGACRQVILEYEIISGNDIKIYLKDDNDMVHILNSIKDVLPLSFDATFL
jgi:cytidine deaminase